jgi:hypothetical protein
MHPSLIMKSLLPLVLLLTHVICTAAPSPHPRSTKEILKSIAHKSKKDFYKKIENIPEFDPRRHSDGCSGGMSSIYAKLKFLHPKYGKTLAWQHCCETHDRAYYKGGSQEEKKMADKKLRDCVSEAIGSKYLGFFLGALMEKAVWVGGKPYFPTTYRWGYGEDFRKTKNLSTKNKNTT